jgi:hypothetical protein
MAGSLVEDKENMPGNKRSSIEAGLTPASATKEKGTKRQASLDGNTDLEMHR